MQNQLLQAALVIAKPWYVRAVDFDPARKASMIGIDFVAGKSRFAAPGLKACIGSMRTSQAKSRSVRSEAGPLAVDQLYRAIDFLAVWSEAIERDVFCAVPTCCASMSI
jgi:hypothetical protein